MQESLKVSTPATRGETGARLAAPVMEVFASIQGEGLHVGEPQVFLRLLGCPLRCTWCDTPGSWGVPDEPVARIRLPRTDRDDPAGLAGLAGTGAPEVREEAGWATPFRAATWVAEVEGGVPRTVSVTGGEPLLWPAFVGELSTFLGPRRLHLETAGAHPAALERVLDAVDHVSLDLKLPRDLEAPVPVAPGDPGTEPPPVTPEQWADVRVRCLALVRGRDACAKIVVAGDRTPLEFLPLLDDVAERAPELPVFLQPVTPVAGVPAPDRALLEGVAELALERALAVRVVPQVHRILRVP